MHSWRSMAMLGSARKISTWKCNWPNFRPPAWNESIGRRSAGCSRTQHPVAGGIQFAMLSEVAGVHLGVAVDLRPLEPIHLDVARSTRRAISLELSASDRSTWMSRERSTRRLISAELSASVLSARSR